MNKHIQGISIAGIVFLGIVSGQTLTIRDTINVHNSETELRVSHTPVIESTLQIFHNGQWLSAYTLDPINGVIHLPEPLAGQFIIYYRYVNVPAVVGPYYTFLPPLEMDSIPEIQSPVTNRLQGRRKAQTLVSNGTIFRNIGISPLGGNDFSGGLQFQVQGQLGEDLFLNGILTDRDIPIQPEGNTQSLEEIDKVFIQVTHPKFLVEAGDINIDYKSGKFLNISRKLTGIKYNYNSERWKAKAFLAGSDGEFNILEFRGEDGRQGPYFLTSKTGNRDVIVLSGTEKVYLDGKLLTRGENFDYIIDYSRGELTFNPKHIIHTYSYIYIEYQYSDFNYSRNVLGSQVAYHKPEMDIALSWVREKDIFSPSQQQISSSMVDIIKAAGDSLVSIQTGSANPEGKYVLDDGIYVYWELAQDTSLDRYSVTFQFDALNGSYIKKISSTGKLYFAYLEPEKRYSTIDLYSPGRKLIAPKVEEIFQIQGMTKFGSLLTIDGELGVSHFDKNRLSSRDDADNVGLGYQSAFSGKEIHITKDISWDYSISIWGRTENFREMSRERDVSFARTWNTTTGLTEQKEQLFDGNFVLRRQADRIEVGRSHYMRGAAKKDRLFTKFYITKNWFPEISADFNKVTDKKLEFSEVNTKIVALPGKIHPTYVYQYQHDRRKTKFTWNTIGIEYLGSDIKSSAKIGQKIDYAQIDSSTAQLDTLSAGVFGEIDFTRKVRFGWSGSVQLRKRIIDSFAESTPSMDFTMAQISTRFSRPKHPVRLEVQIRSEQTFSEQRALVYDSVGVGFGQYRYDPVYNEYIPDPNGAFIAYTAFTGDREPVTRLESLSRLRLNGRQQSLALFKPLQSLTELKIKFDGDNISFSFPAFRSPLSADDISREFWQLRQEFTYRSLNSIRLVRFRHRQKRDLLGSDPRGNDLKRHRVNEIEWQEPIPDNWRWIQKGELHNYVATSTVSSVRNRTVKGWWVEGGPQWNGSRDWQIKLFGIYGTDRGEHYINSYEISFRGMNIEIIRFYKSTSRFQVNAEWVRSENQTTLTNIPPEANRGLPLGESLKITGMTEIRFGKHLSMLSTLNIINNQRYNDFIAFNGELRAYF